MIELSGVAKSFTLHNREGTVIRVMEGVTVSVAPGVCVALTGKSDTGKSTLMRMIYGKSLAGEGRILVGAVDVTTAAPREILARCPETLGHVSRFLRVVPRVPTREVVAEPLLAVGTNRDEVLKRAEEPLTRLHIPVTLWSLSPTTASGGEQQRLNSARGFAHPFAAMRLDQPTAALDATDRNTSLKSIDEAKAGGGAIFGIFHDAEVRAQVATREADVSGFAPEPVA